MKRFSCGTARHLHVSAHAAIISTGFAASAGTPLNRCSSAAVRTAGSGYGRWSKTASLGRSKPIAPVWSTLPGVQMDVISRALAKIPPFTFGAWMCDIVEDNEMLPFSQHDNALRCRTEQQVGPLPRDSP